MTTQPKKSQVLLSLAVAMVAVGCGSSQQDRSPLIVGKAPPTSLLGSWTGGCYTLPGADDLNNLSRQYSYNFAANASVVEQETGYADGTCAKATTKQEITYTYSVGEVVAGSDGAQTLDLTGSRVVLTLLDPTDLKVPDLCGAPGTFLISGHPSTCAGNDSYQIVKVDANVLHLGLVEEDLGSPAQRPKVLDLAHPFKPGK